MTTKDDGGAAFPCDSREARTFAGMSLRDYFAGQALAGELASQTESVGTWPGSQAPALAERMYLFADAMLAERGKA